MKPNLTIILLSKDNDKNLLNLIKKFIIYSPNCNLFVTDSSKKRDVIEEVIKERNNIKIIYNQKNGIYPSLNKALDFISTKYYLVLGLDDKLNFKNLQKFLYLVENTNVDFIFAGVIKGSKKLNNFKLTRKSILEGPSGIIPSHTGGVAIRKDLHKKYGKYSIDYKIVSDTLFISRCLLDNCSSIVFNNFLSKVGNEGFSKKYEYLAEYECFVIRNLLGTPIIKSFFIFFIRLFKRKIKNIIKRLKFFIS